MPSTDNRTAPDIPTDAPLLSASNLHVTFEDKKVLNGVSIDLWAGESVVLLGRSGSGKSVLLKVLLGLLKPQSGTITFEGKAVTKPHHFDRISAKSGMLFQAAALFDSLNVHDNVGFALDRSIPKTEHAERIRSALAKVDLDPNAVSSLYPSDLSGGMRKRVGLSRAIVHNPDVLFFDEPTTGLDPITSLAINDLIRHINTEQQTASLTITHDMGSMKQIADRVLFLHDGKIVLNAATRDIDAIGDNKDAIGDNKDAIGDNRDAIGDNGDAVQQLNRATQENHDPALIAAGIDAFRAFLNYGGAA